MFFFTNKGAITSSLFFYLKGDIMKKPPPVILTTEDLARLISGIKVKLDCGHHCTIGHQFANTLIIHSLGGGKIETKCHDCGY